MSVLISVPIGMAISQYSNLNHACALRAKMACAHIFAIFIAIPTHTIYIKEWQLQSRNKSKG